jgi:hypothetical protein
MAATIHDLDAYRPHLSGPARCLACGYCWVTVAPVGTVVGLECAQCGLSQGSFEGLISPETRFVCQCWCDIYYLLPAGCLCVRCGLQPMVEG